MCTKNEPLILVPDSLLQFCTLDFQEKSFRTGTESWVYQAQALSGAVSPAMVSLQVLSPEEGRKLPVREVLSPRLQDILYYFEDEWVPLPWLRGQKHIGGMSYLNGPSNWVRGRLRRGENGLCIDLAFDTAIERDPAMNAGERIYNGPTPEDVKNCAYFTLPETPVPVRDWVAANPWVGDMLRLILEERRRSKKSRSLPQDPRFGDREHPLTILAAYFAMLGGLSCTEEMPQIRFTNEGDRPIGVDLVLDFGNSRSCGILIEEASDKALSKAGSFGSCRILGLRDMRNPQNLNRDFFSSRVEFSQADFGDMQSSRRSGRAQAFLWPSPLRVGKEAENMMAARQGTEGFSGLASPKRYLWDRKPVFQGWFFNEALLGEAQAEKSPKAVHGAFRSRLLEILKDKDAEIPLNVDLVEEQDKPDLTAAKRTGLCKLSKSEIFILMTEEIVLQTIAFINAAEERDQGEQKNVPRRLRSVSLSFPSGMSLAERRILKRRAQAGLRMAWDETGQEEAWRRFGEAFCKPPKLECCVDEATATQMVWLENEINNRMGGDVEAFYQLYGRKLASPAGKMTQKMDTLRVATIDIGGGTTDIMICSYDRVSGEETLHPRLGFRDSFRIAGDNLLEGVISDIVLKAMRKYLNAAGVKDLKAFFSDLFKSGKMNESTQEKTLRQLFVSTLLEPAGLEILHLCEQAGSYEMGEIAKFPLDAPSQASLPRKAELENWFREALKRHCQKYSNAGNYTQEFQNWLTKEISSSEIELEEEDETEKALFNPFSAEISVVMEEMDKVFQRQLGTSLDTLCSVVQAYGCDVLLLSGRPSKLRQTRNRILSALPVAPQRVISMHEYKVSNDYPFSDDYHRIGDPKSTVVMGTVIWRLACQNKIGNFRIWGEDLEEGSNVRFLGAMQERGEGISHLFNKKPYQLTFPKGQMPEDEAERDFICEIDVFEGSMFIGSKQIPQDLWPASPLYRAEITQLGKELIRDRYRAKGPYKLVLERSRTFRTEGEQAAECFVVKSLSGKGVETGEDYDFGSDAAEIVRLTLQTTLVPQGHWRDTGVLQVADL